MKLDDWEMRVAFAKEDWPQVVSIMESTFGISLAGRPIEVTRGLSTYSEIIVFMSETGSDYSWDALCGFAQEQAGNPIGEQIYIFPPRNK